MKFSRRGPRLQGLKYQYPNVPAKQAIKGAIACFDKSLTVWKLKNGKLNRTNLLVVGSQLI